MAEINIIPTVNAIEDMATRFEEYAQTMRKHAAKIRETKDLSRAGDALNDVVNCLINSRLDLIVSRPIRELQIENEILRQPEQIFRKEEDKSG